MLQMMLSLAQGIVIIAAVALLRSGVKGMCRAYLRAR